MENRSELVIYTTEDGLTKVDVTFENETVWLTQEQMSELFQRDRSVITKHIRNIFTEGELDEKSNVQFLHIANSDKPVKYYNLDAVLSSGSRELLEGSGSVSHAQALQKAKSEYGKYRNENLSPVEKAYFESIKATEKTAKKKLRETKTEN